jgi:S-adenosylmethionine hydrolase
MQAVDGGNSIRGSSQEGVMAAVITLTTDFGQKDGYVGTMKGVILSIAPLARIVDISHDIRPQDLRQAMYILSTAVPYFPPSTVHVVVVDPGVGSARRPIAVRTGSAYYVAPDNGVLSYPLGEPDSSVVHLDCAEYWLPVVSNTFHGRDIFSPVGAHLAAGVPFHVLGTEISDAITLPLPQPERLADGSLRGQVQHADRFGNLITDIPMSWLAEGMGWRFEIAGRRIAGLSITYAAVARGELIALAGSDGLLEISIREGNAAETLPASAGTVVTAMPHAIP